MAATRGQEGEEGIRPESRDLTELVAKQVEKGSAGLPVGVQIVAIHWRQDIVLTVMSILEKQFRKRQSYPDFKKISTNLLGEKFRILTLDYSSFEFFRS